MTKKRGIIIKIPLEDLDRVLNERKTISTSYEGYDYIAYKDDMTDSVHIQLRTKNDSNLPVILEGYQYPVVPLTYDK